MKSGDYHKGNSKRKNPTQKTFNKKNSECYKCGKKGHFKNECKSKAKASTPFKVTKLAKMKFLNS